MSDNTLAVKKPQPKATLAKPRRKAKPMGEGQATQAPEQVAQAPGQSLVQVAATAARSEVEAAKRVYLDEKRQGVTELFDFIREEQSATSVAIEDAVLAHHGLTHDDIYLPPTPAGE